MHIAEQKDRREYCMLFWMMVTVFCIEADYEVYILMRLPLISQCFVNKWLVHRRVNSGWYTERVNMYLLCRARKHAVGTTGAVIIQFYIIMLFKIFFGLNS